MGDDKLYTPEEVAERLQLSEQTVRRWLREEKLKGVKLGSKWRIRERDIQELLKEKLQDL